MAMASTIQPYADVKNRPFDATKFGGMQMGDALMMQMEDAAINKQRQQAATAGLNRSMLGPMTLQALQGSYFG